MLVIREPSLISPYKVAADWEKGNVLNTQSEFTTIGVHKNDTHGAICVFLLIQGPGHLKSFIRGYLQIPGSCGSEASVTSKMHCTVEKNILTLCEKQMKDTLICFAYLIQNYL